MFLLAKPQNSKNTSILMLKYKCRFITLTAFSLFYFIKKFTTVTDKRTNSGRVILGDIKNNEEVAKKYFQ